MGRARPRFEIARRTAIRAAWLALFVALAWPVSTGAQTTAPADRETLLRLLRQLPAQPGTGQIAPDRLGTAPETEPAGAAVEADGAQDEAEINSVLRRYCASATVPDESLELEKAFLAARFSRLEMDYCRRAAQLLRQFGYDVFSVAPIAREIAVGAIPSDYVLGIGDELAINFYGQEPQSLIVGVDREGLVIVPGLSPIPAAGRNFAEFRRELKAVTARTKLGTEVFVSLARLRAIRVLVAGDVGRPGLHLLTGLSTIFDALRAADGVTKTGSLRRVQLRRGNNIIWVDLYDLFFATGLSYQVGVADGDQITVPTIGATIAAAGDVLRPGIYELAEGQQTATMDQILDFAGGPLRPRGNDLIRISFTGSGSEVVTERAAGQSATVVDGDIVVVRKRRDIQSGTVTLSGHVRVPRRHSLTRVKTVRDLVHSAETLREDPYLPFAVLETSDPATRARRLFAVNLQRILAGEQDYTLRDADRLIVLSAVDIRFLSSAWRPEPEEPASPSSELPREQQGQTTDPQDPGPQGGGRGARQSRPADPLGRAPGAARDGLVAGRERRQPQVFVDFEDLLPFALQHIVAVNGEVLRPGPYPVANDTPLESIIAVAGGLTREVDLTRLEISRFSPAPYKGLSENQRRTIDLSREPIESVLVQPGDMLRFNAVFTDRESGPVELQGEFVRPGSYEITRGETLSSVLRRAGGLTEQAYAYGAIFTRESVRRAEQQGFARAARELNASIAATVAKGDERLTDLVLLRQITAELSNVPAVGRIVIEADPTVLQVRPELDSVLEPGDRIFVPKRPNFVSVIGDVLNPGALQFSPGKTADAYISQAGDFQRSADEDRVFVVLPNGSAQPLSLSAWNFTSVRIPPGSTIVVPKDPAPFNLLKFSTNITDLISKVALTAASLAVISRQ